MIELDKNITDLIDIKAKEMNPNAEYCSNEVSTYINQLNSFIDGALYLDSVQIKSLLDRLVGYYTITLEIPIDQGLKIARAVKYDVISDKPCFENVSRLSYIPKDAGVKPSIGRLNKHGESIYYGCIYFNDTFGGINVVFSEVDAIKSENINVLKSESTEELKVYYIGIYDYIRRDSRPYFLTHETYEYFKSVYEYAESKLDEFVFMAFKLCDAFFSDILRRKKSDKLYIVTSILGALFLESPNIDGLIYNSVAVEGSPVIALKPESVDKKIVHKTATAFFIQARYGYGMFKAKRVNQGVVNGDKIDWEPVILTV
ncbi:hypothetical protein Dacet_0547 [Denitrovibrio acetiphilus DSM 12809]|uniref:Uncharacterized protein n=1 Tax=Denitrovibrio acetiphilus (strain DSM 12809 / NBRC 114555 / N2460) TaxID=522772 RepID=D4H434_DENA2|nr:hypothetical protein [Denitrovibrio acetiphilus]ADD67345.1 hypothetical protein Dacet_0547 [Denitrovibrio acetiphilus DSM 12809]